MYIIHFVTDLFLICGVLFMVITTSIAIFKNEKDTRLEDDHIKLNTFQNYKLLWDISNLPCIKILAIAMLTSFVSMNTTKVKFKFSLFNIRLNNWHTFLLPEISSPIYPRPVFT